MQVMTWWRNERKLVMTWALVCLCLSMLCENSMTTVMWRRKFMILHVLQLHQDAENHARMSALDEFLGWEDEMIEAQLAVQAQRIWNKTDLEYDQMIQKEHEAHLYWTLAYQEQQDSLAQEQQAVEDGYKFNTYYQLAREEAYEAAHLQDGYCDKYYIPTFWCRWVGQFAGWDSIQAQQSMQATNDMQLALIEEQAAKHAALLARWYRTNATRHAQLANASAWQAQWWNASYQRDKQRAQQLDVITNMFKVHSQQELSNATQYALEAQQEWQQAITLAHHVVTFQDEAAIYAMLAMVFAAILLFLAVYHLANKSCRTVTEWLGSYHHYPSEPDVMHRVIYALGHVCIFILVLGGTLRDQNGQILLLLLEQKDATLHASRGAIVVMFAMQAALVQWMYLYVPSGLYTWTCQEQDDEDNEDGDRSNATYETARSTWQVMIIHALGAFVRHYLLPSTLFCLEMLILINLRCVSVFAIRDTTWWFLFVLLLLVSAIYFLFQLPLPPPAQTMDSSQYDATSIQPLASEHTPLMQSEDSVNHVAKSENNNDVEGANSEDSRSLVDVELATTASSPTMTAQPCSHGLWGWCCTPHDPNPILQEEIMSIRTHASFLELPLTVLILVRAYNLIFYHCLPTLHRLRPGVPTWIVPTVIMVVTCWLIVQSLMRRHEQTVAILAKGKSIH